MQKLLLLTTAVVFFLGCNPSKETVSIIKGKDGIDGSSCSVSDYRLSSYEEEMESEVLGAMISCTDGSSAIILNGQNGTDGLNGLDGLDGENGIDGINGIDGQDGRDGKNGKNGKACSIKRNKHKDYVVVTCGNASVKIYDGKDGKDGADGKDGLDGKDGEDGEDGLNGEDGKNGSDGEDGQNGSDGQDGADGSDGTNGTNATTKESISMTSNCKIIDGSNSAKLNGSSSEVKLYSSTDCSGNSESLHDGEVAITDNGNLLLNVSGTNNLQLVKFN